MSFQSNYAHLIWNKLYSVSIPDQVTLDPEYIKRFGVIVTSDKKIDKMLSTNFTNVMIPVIKMLEYYTRGVEIRIHSREDMVTIYKDIDNYLNEWREHIRYDINLALDQSKELLIELEKLAKDLHNKAKPVELIDNLFAKRELGIRSPFQVLKEVKQVYQKPEYDGISKLIRSKTRPQGRF